MKTKHIAGGAFLLNTLGSYYAVSKKEVLDRIDPIIHSFCAMMTLVSATLIILARSWYSMTRQVVKSGFVLGSWLCSALFMPSITLRYDSATGTGFFPALNGQLVAPLAWTFPRQSSTETT
jgi:hypothetical protein